MALAHRQLPVVGVQFHPESILTDGGYELLADFCGWPGLAVAPPLPTIDQRTACRWPLPNPPGRSNR